MEEKTGTVGPVLFGSMWGGLDVEGRFGESAYDIFTCVAPYRYIFVYISIIWLKMN